MVPIGLNAFRAEFESSADLAEARKSETEIVAALARTLSRAVTLQLEVSGSGKALEELIGRPLPKKHVPEQLIPVAQVYETAQRNWGLQRRAVQWYATEAFIPKPKRLGREAYYDKRTIYSYFQIIHMLTGKRFAFSLNQVRVVLRKLEQIKNVKGPNGKQSALAATESFLLNHIQYESQVWAIYSIPSHDDSRSLSGKYSKRLNDVRNVISDALCGNADRIRNLLQKSLLDIEAEIEELEKEVPF